MSSLFKYLCLGIVLTLLVAAEIMVYRIRVRVQIAQTQAMDAQIKALNSMPTGLAELPILLPGDESAEPISRMEKALGPLFWPEGIYPQIKLPRTSLAEDALRAAAFPQLTTAEVKNHILAARRFASDSALNGYAAVLFTAKDNSKKIILIQARMDNVWWTRIYDLDFFDPISAWEEKTLGPVWMNGVFSPVHLPGMATAEDVLRTTMENSLGSDKYKVLETRHYGPTSAFPDGTAILYENGKGARTILATRYDGANSWWIRTYSTGL